MKKKAYLFTLFILFVFLPNYAIDSTPEKILENLEAIKLSMELHLINDESNPEKKERLSNLVLLAKKNLKQLTKLPKSREQKEALERGKSILKSMQIINKKTTNIKTPKSTTKYSIAETTNKIIGLIKILNDLKERNENAEMYISGYYLERILEKSRKIANNLKNKEATELLQKIKKAGRSIAKKWLSIMLELEERAAKRNQLTEFRIIFMAINDKEEFENLNYRALNDKKRFDRLLRNFFGGPTEQNHLEKLLTEIEWKSDKKAKIETTRDLFNYDTTLLLEKIKKAEKTYQNLENLKDFALDNTENFQQLRKNYAKTLQFLAKNKEEIPDKILRTYVYLPLRKNLKQTFEKIEITHKKALENKKTEIEKKLKKINNMNISELEKLDKELERFKHLMLETIGDEDYDFFLNKLFENEEKRERHQFYINFSSDANQTIENAKEKL